MLYKENWIKSKERLQALWENEIIDRCCVAISAPKNGKQFIDEKLSIKGSDIYKCYTDPERLLERHKERFNNTYFGGDAFPCIFPFFGTSGHSKYFRGSKYKYISNTVWYEQIIKDWQNDVLEYKQKESVFIEEKRIIGQLAEEGKDRFFVSMPDNCGNLDALVNLRGATNVLLDMIDNPQYIKDACKTILDVYKSTSKELFNIIKNNNEGGSSHGWMNTWSNGRHAQMQVDFSVMISPEMFEQFALDELEDITQWLDYSIYHLDGEEQIKHLDLILSLKKLNMIQWVPVSGQPSVLNYIDIFRKIQKAGKGLILFIEKEDIEKILLELSSKGLLLIITNAKTEDEAKQIEKKVKLLTN